MKSTRAGTAALVGLFLSGTVALAAAPSFIPTANVGAANEVHDAEASESPDASEAPDASDSPEATDAAGEQDGHGAAVSAVAKDKSAVGGKHHNHGGAVSAIARGTHGRGGKNETSDKSDEGGD